MLLQELANGRVDLRETEENLTPKPGTDPLINQAHGVLHQSFVPGATYSRGHYHHAVMAGKIVKDGVQSWLVGVGSNHCGPGVVRNKGAGASAEIVKSSFVGPDPVLLPLAFPSFHVGQFAGSQDRDKLFQQPSLSRVPVDHLKLVSCPVHQYRLSRLVLDVHGDLFALTPLTEVQPELAVLVALGVFADVLLPQPFKGRPLFLQLDGHLGKQSSQFRIA